MKLFTAEWCVNCKPIKRMIEDNTWTVDIIDVDRSPDLVRASGVKSVPCLLLGDGSIVVGSGKIQEVIKEAYANATPDSN